MENKKVALIQCWIGPIPDYFWFHYETTKNIYGIDFYLFTDQNIKLDAENYFVNHINIDSIENIVNQRLNTQIRILSNKKVCDLKASLGDIFYEYIKEYQYFGFYDIDTLFGDTHKYILSEIGNYDVISTGNEIYHNRIGGPFCILKNTDELRTLYKSEEFINCFSHDWVDCFEEGFLNHKLLEKYSVKIIYDMNCESDNGGKNTYDAFFSGGKLFSNNREIFLYHFYRKNTTKLNKVGNVITAGYDKKFINDFYWVVSFTKDYEKLFSGFADSMKKYSNRKCIVYSINYDYLPDFNLINSEQFIFRRIDIIEGDKDYMGRDINIITSKPKINLDALDYSPNSKFVSIDVDSYLTSNSDEIKKYFNHLENYPLFNSHVWDVVNLKNIVHGQEWSSPLHILADEMGVNVEVFPRRKTNVAVFDVQSKWFFEEQMNIYSNYKNIKEGILALHDEDTANIILNKNKYTKSLPLVDTEDVNYIDFDLISNYNFSEHLEKPKTKNDILFFHGIKNQNRVKELIENYGKSVIECEEFYIQYRDGKVSFEKNSFLTTKNFSNVVSFKIYDKNDNLVFNLSGMEIRNYFYFFIDSLFLEKGDYVIKITEDKDDFCIFRDILSIK